MTPTEFCEAVLGWGCVNPMNAREVLVDTSTYAEHDWRMMAHDCGIGVELHPVAEPDTVRLSSLRAFRPGNGAGTSFMTHLVRLADEQGITLVLTAQPLATQVRTPVRRLVPFYRRFGFTGPRRGMRRVPHARAVEVASDALLRHVRRHADWDVLADDLGYLFWTLRKRAETQAVVERAAGRLT